MEEIKKADLRDASEGERVQSALSNWVDISAVSSYLGDTMTGRLVDVRGNSYDVRSGVFVTTVRSSIWRRAARWIKQKARRIRRYDGL